MSKATTFRPPTDWPDAKPEKALDTSYEKLGDLIVKVDQTYPRGDLAAELKRQALEKMREGKALLFRAYHAEMAERLAIWRDAGYRL